MGGSIDGDSDADGSRSSTSVSADGTVVAIGAMGVSVTRMYRFETDGSTAAGGDGTWVQMGRDLVGEAVDDRAGDSVSLFSDGTIVAVGARGNNGNGRGSGHVRV